MNFKLLKLQVLLGILLSLTLVAEWAYGRYTWRQLQPRLHAPASEGAELLALPQIPAQKSSAEAYSEMVDRPLFIPNRKPLPEAEEGGQTQDAETGQIDDWLLIGVYRRGHQPATALFAKKNEAKKYLKLSMGQTISGWQLKELKSDRVILEQAGQTKSVLLRKPRQDPKTPAAAKPVLPFPPFPVKPPNNPNPEHSNNDSETN